MPNHLSKKQLHLVDIGKVQLFSNFLFISPQVTCSACTPTCSTLACSLLLSLGLLDASLP